MLRGGSKPRKLCLGGAKVKLKNIIFLLAEITQLRCMGILLLRRDAEYGIQGVLCRLVDCVLVLGEVQIFCEVVVILEIDENRVLNDLEFGKN